VLERSLYNGALDGLSLSGNRFFYGNPLASRGQHQRREWFGTACCPANIARLVASLGDYIYAKTKEALYINLFVGSETKINLGKTELVLKMETNYPWEGRIRLQIDPVKKSKFKIYTRVPGWYKNQIAPGGLYKTPDDVSNDFLDPTIKVNGKPVEYKMENGYALIEADWKKGDVLEINFPMAPIVIESRPELKFNNNRVALQLGPLVYCVEGADNGGKAWNFIVPPGTRFAMMDYKVLDENVKALTATVPVISVGADGLSLKTEKRKIIAIPYYTWANRGKNEMQVWLPTLIKDVKINY
jgi:DUF1680 family protein